MTITEESKLAVPEDRSVAVTDEMIDAVMANVDAGGLELLGPDGVLAELTKRLLERGLAEELSDHLGYEPGDPAGRGSGNNRNGASPKTVLTEIGAVDLDIPRDRLGTFEPQLVPKHSRRLEGFNQNIVHLYARGLTTRDIRRELGRMYGVEVSPALISKVTDGIVEERRVAGPAPRRCLPDPLHRRPGGEGPHPGHRGQQGRLPGRRGRCRGT